MIANNFSNNYTVVIIYVFMNSMVSKHLAWYFGLFFANNFYNRLTVKYFFRQFINQSLKKLG